MSHRTTLAGRDAVLGRPHRPGPGGPDYTTFHQPGEQEPMGGIGGMFGADALPSHWLVYFGVADVPAAMAAAEGAGGTAIGPPMQTPWGAMAGLTDPGGAGFWVSQTGVAPMPDRSA